MEMDDDIDDHQHHRTIMLQKWLQGHNQRRWCYSSGERKKINHHGDSSEAIFSLNARRRMKRRRRRSTRTRYDSSSSRLHHPLLSLLSLVLFCILPAIPGTAGLSQSSSRIVSKKPIPVSFSKYKKPPSAAGGGDNPNNFSKQLISGLQKCYTPQDVLQNVGQYVTPQVDPYGKLSSSILVRLSKQLITQSNGLKQGEKQDFPPDWNGVSPQIIATLAQANWIGESDEEVLDSIVEGTKAASILSRMLVLSPSVSEENLASWDDTFGILTSEWERRVGDDVDDDKILMSKLQPHQLSGLKWSWDCFALNAPSSLRPLPLPLQTAYDELRLPFRIRPGYFGGHHHENGGHQHETLTVLNLKEEVEFQIDEIKTESNRIVKERRQTAWQGDDHVGPFLYSGKCMERHNWSPSVLQIRDQLLHVGGNTTGADGGDGVYYDCCLLNLYPDGGSGMRYHIDPDQGTLWGYETAVVSVGATRKFAFRDIPSTQQPQSTSPPPPSERNDDPSAKKKTRKGRDTKKQQGQQKQVPKPHSFVVMHGDVTEMFADCQSRYQHTVKQAETKTETSERISLVFKRTL